MSATLIAAVSGSAEALISRSEMTTFRSGLPADS
jgi:hypothetical protein